MSLINFINRGSALLVACAILGAGCAVRQPGAPAAPPRGEALRIAVLPVYNLSEKSAPLAELRRLMAQELLDQGQTVLAEAELEPFMSRHRVRHTGGIDTVTAQAMDQELGIHAVLITSLEQYETRFPPKISLTARLVSTGEKPRILWVESVGLSGDDRRGILDLRLVHDPLLLQKSAVKRISASFAGFLSGKGPVISNGVGDRRFRPKIVYKSGLLVAGKKYTVAVLPFKDRYSRKNSAEIMALHFVRQLAKSGYDVVDPGIIRQSLLNSRVIMNEGPSVRDLDVLFETLDTDLVLTGNLLDYQNQENPTADFAVTLFERQSRKIVWSSRSYGTGNDGVFFFDWKQIRNSEAMVSRMAASIVEVMMGEEKDSLPRGSEDDGKLNSFQRLLVRTSASP